jgi:hypothetical protein
VLRLLTNGVACIIDIDQQSQETYGMYASAEDRNCNHTQLCASTADPDCEKGVKDVIRPYKTTIKHAFPTIFEPFPVI